MLRSDINRFLLIGSLFVVTLLKPLMLCAEFGDDVRLWQTLGLKFYEDDQWRLSASVQTRLYDEGKYLGAWLLLPTLEYKLHPNLDVGGTYLLEDIRSESGTDFGRLHIFWLHASPHWQLTDQLKLSMRHVLGYRAVESSDNYWISRHRFSFDYKLRNMGPLVGVGASDEVFYNYDNDRVFENRLVPLKLTFKVSERSRLSLFYMAQSKRMGSGSHWTTAHVFGQSFSYSF